MTYDIIIVIEICKKSVLYLFSNVLFITLPRSQWKEHIHEFAACIMQSHLWLYTTHTTRVVQGNRVDEVVSSYFSNTSHLTPIQWVSLLMMFHFHSKQIALMYNDP